MAAPALELTILMPCLNEAETLPNCIVKAMAFLDRTGIAGEVLIADNGSTDGSQAIAQRYGARVALVTSKGYGAALAGGIALARGKFVIMADADDSYDFAHLDLFVDALRDGADLVMGNRFKGGIAPGAMPFHHRYLGNPVLSFAGRLFFGSAIGDFHCGLRGFQRAAIRGLALRTSGMEFASEMVVKATLANLKIVEVPTRLAKDGRSRAPHLRSFRDGWRHLRFLLLFSPRWLFLYPGTALLLFGLGLLAILTPGPVHITPNITLDIHTLLVAAMCIIVGLQAISFALIARSFATRYGLIPPSTNWNRVLQSLTLERILGVALLLAGVGAAGLLWSVGAWAEAGFGPLTDGQLMRTLVLSITGLISGMQLAMSGFLASLIDIPLNEGRVTNAPEIRVAPVARKAASRRSGT